MDSHSTKQRLCSIVLLVFMQISPMELCGPPASTTANTAANAGGTGTGTTNTNTNTNTNTGTTTTCTAPACTGTEPTGVRGINTFDAQGNCFISGPNQCSCPGFSWPTVKASGIEYVLYAITQGAAGTSCTSEIANIKAANLIVSGQHEAIPSQSSGAAQARLFFNNGGAWTGDCLTLPGTLHMQHDTAAGDCFNNFRAGPCCYGLDQAGMQAWIADFASTYLAISGRTVILSTDAPFWSDCTGNWNGLSANPLVIANADDPTCGTAAKPNCPMVPGLPWQMFSFWLDRRSGQPGVAAASVFGDRYEGSLCKLQHFATGT